MSFGRENRFAVIESKGRIAFVGFTNLNVSFTAPSNLQVTDSTSETLDVSVDTYTERQIVGYNWYIDGVKDNSEPTEDPSYQFTGLTPNTDYDIQASVVVKFNSLESSLTSILTATTVGLSVIALLFDGTDDYIDLSTHVGSFPTGGNVRTIEGWFDAGNTANFRWFDYGANTTGGRVSITATGDSIAVAAEGHNYGVTGLGLSGYHHLAVVFPSGASLSNEFLMYLDGSLLNPIDLAGAARTVNTGSTYAYFGKREGSGDGHFGLIDEMRIWNTERTSTQINDNMEKLLEGTETGLVAYWNCEDEDATQLTDLTSNNLHGTFVGPTYTEESVF